MFTEVQERKRIGVYCRVSTREQAMYGYGIGVQKSKIQGYLELFDRNPDSIIYYIDEGISAKDMKRAEMTKLIADVEAGIIEEIIIYKLDRLSRCVTDVYEFIEKLLKLNCNLISVMDNIDIHTANGRMLIGLLAIISQWERETIKERTEDGLISAAEQGKFPVGYTPLGYDKENSILKINEIDQKVVIKIFELACEGNTVKEIEQYLAEDIKPRNNVLNAEAIKKILMKKIYYGEFAYKGQTYMNVVPAIISKTVFEQANKSISKRFKVYDNTKYWFGNKIRCTCGEILNRVSTQKKKKTYYYYYCDHCKKRFNQEQIIDTVLPDIYAKFNYEHFAKKSKEYLHKLQAINKKMNKMYSSFRRGIVDVKIYATTMTALEYERKSLEAEKMIKDSIHYVEWNNYSDIEKKKFIQLTVKEVIIDLDLKCIVHIEYK